MFRHLHNLEIFSESKPKGSANLSQKAEKREAKVWVLKVIKFTFQMAYCGTLSRALFCRY
jgi:hypothetical protein